MGHIMGDITSLHMTAGSVERVLSNEVVRGLAASELSCKGQRSVELFTQTQLTKFADVHEDARLNFRSMEVLERPIASGSSSTVMDVR